MAEWKQNQFAKWLWCYFNFKVCERWDTKVYKEEKYLWNLIGVLKTVHGKNWHMTVVNTVPCPVVSEPAGGLSACHSASRCAT